MSKKAPNPNKKKSVAKTKDTPKTKKKRINKKILIPVIIGVVVIIAVVVLIIVANATRKVTINGEVYTGMSQEEAEALYKQEQAEKAKYIAAQKAACQAKGKNSWDYTYLSDTDECITTEEYQARKKLASEDSYNAAMKQYANDPAGKTVWMWNNYEQLGTVCKRQILEKYGYGHMYEVASGKINSKISNDNITKTNGDNITISHLTVSYTPSTLVKNKPSLHQDSRTFDDQSCDVNLKTDFIDQIQEYFKH